MRALGVVTNIFVVALALIFGFLLFGEPEELKTKFWDKNIVCSQWLAAVPLGDEVYDCRLDKCQRLDVKGMDTLVDSCTCELNNKTVYRYCQTKMIFYEYKGDVNADAVIAADVFD